jgi:putative IMPACT (imprinted ancient) family translation regulator
VRAYGGSARDCLKLCTRVFVQRKVKMVIQTSFDQLGAVYNCLDKCKAEREAEEYTASGDIEISVQVAADIWEQLQQAVGNATNGRVIPQVVEESEDE